MEKLIKSNPLSLKIILILFIVMAFVVSCTARNQAMKLNTRLPELIQQKKYAEAEKIAEETLYILVKSSKQESTSTAKSLYNLAIIYQSQGRYRQAEPLLKHALSIFEKVLGPDDLNVAKALNKLAFNYKGQKRYFKAEPLYIRAISIFEMNQGSYNGSSPESKA